MKISVIVPTYNSAATLPSLLDTLVVQEHKDFEIIVVDDCSTDDTLLTVSKYNINYIRMKKNSGPAVCRNVGASSANGDLFAFTDSDCRVDDKWLVQIENNFKNRNIDVLMGRLIIDRSDYFGDSISALGFPAGGSLGFDKVWKVDSRGYTNSLSSCNCAIKRELFDRMSGFDETFPYPGGEDSFLAYRIVQSGYKIKYCQDVVVYHGARDSLRSFIKWQFRRGISSFIFSRKISDRANYASLRLWSTANVLRFNLKDIKFPLIALLLVSSFIIQAAGFLYGKERIQL